MCVLYGVLSGIVLCGVITYACFAGFYRSDAGNAQRIRFKDFIRIYSVAPEKWEIYEDHLFYQTDTWHNEAIYMKSYSDAIRIRRIYKKMEKLDARTRYSQKRAELLKMFSDDILSYNKRLNNALEEMTSDAVSIGKETFRRLSLFDGKIEVRIY